jgi:hypothetical protein
MELVVNQTYQNQLVINRFHYIASGTPAAVTLSYGLLYATGYISSRLSAGVWPGTTIAGQHQALVVPGLKFISALARDLYSVSDFYEAPFPVNPAGIFGGAAASPLLAYGMFGSRVRTDIRRGQKRIAGVSEDGMDAGGVVSAAALGVLANVCEGLGQTLTFDDEGNTLTYQPCVLGLVEYETERGNRAYRRFPTAGEQLEHVAAGGVWSPYAQIRSQTSRQFGRGA